MNQEILNKLFINNTLGRPAVAKAAKEVIKYLIAKSDADHELVKKVLEEFKNE